MADNSEHKKDVASTLDTTTENLLAHQDLPLVPSPQIISEESTKNPNHNKIHNNSSSSSASTTISSNSEVRKSKEEGIWQHLLTSTTHLQLSNTLVCGALAGIAAKTVIAPVERIKMTFQVSSDRFSLQAALKRGQETIAKEGVFSLWKGHSTTVLRVAPYAALSYTFHDLAELFFQQFTQQERLSPTFKFAAGSIGGLAGTLLTYPLDVLRVRIALGGSWQSSLAQGGLFQGLLPTLLGIAPYAGTAWLVKQTLLEAYVTHMAQNPSIPESLGINAIAGLTGQFVTYPLDILRRRMQIARPIINNSTTNNTNNANSSSAYTNSTTYINNVYQKRSHRYSSMSELLTQLWKEEGLRGLGKGFSLNILKGPISLSVSLTVYDWLRHHIFTTPNNTSSHSFSSSYKPENSSKITNNIDGTTLSGKEYVNYNSTNNYSNHTPISTTNKSDSNIKESSSNNLCGNSSNSRRGTIIGAASFITATAEELSDQRSLQQKQQNQRLALSENNCNSNNSSKDESDS